MLNESDLIIPDWPAPARVKAVQTTRLGGISNAPYDTLNLGEHVNDDPMHVAANRQRLNRFVPAEPLWLKQIHGVNVVDAGQASCLPEADAAYSRVGGAVCTIMSADCLPVLLCNEAGTVVAAVHAGWRGLLDGVVEAAVAAMQAPPASLLAWLGPAIGPQAFEVGGEVRSQFIVRDTAAEKAFQPRDSTQGQDKWLADIYQLARLRLSKLGIENIFGGDFCTYTEHQRFFSYRRDGVTGRMASMIWLS